MFRHFSFEQCLKTLIAPYTLFVECFVPAKTKGTNLLVGKFRKSCIVPKRTKKVGRFGHSSTLGSTIIVGLVRKSIRYTHRRAHSHCSQNQINF